MKVFEVLNNQDEYHDRLEDLLKKQHAATYNFVLFLSKIEKRFKYSFLDPEYSVSRLLNDFIEYPPLKNSSWKSAEKALQPEQQEVLTDKEKLKWKELFNKMINSYYVYKKALEENQQ